MLKKVTKFLFKSPTNILLTFVVIIGLIRIFGNPMHLKSSQSKNVDASKAKFVVYGTDWCGYTTKQRKYLDSKYGANSHVYVNCEENPGECKDIKGFPVTKKSDGEMIVGFNSQL